ncbi:MAG TPA: hypothetical protein VGM87_15740 [Roseomonas sp.]|jgi:hypothetical protein
MRSTGQKKGVSGRGGGQAPAAPRCPGCGAGSLRFDRDVPQRSATGRAERRIYLRCTNLSCDFERLAEPGAGAY